jgi:phosphoglycerate kinase
MKTVADFNFNGIKALVRVDFNVPINKSTFEVTDDTRIKAAIPTIQKILEDGGSVVLMSHLGRPKNGPDEKNSLSHIIKVLSDLTGKKIKFSKNCIGEDARLLYDGLNAGEILLLENLRFHPEEEKGDREFAESLIR